MIDLESTSAKAAIFVLIVLALAVFFGVALLKFSHAAKHQPGSIMPAADTQKFESLEKSPGVTSPQGKRWMHNEGVRQRETKSALDQTFEGD